MSARSATPTAWRWQYGLPPVSAVARLELAVGRGRA